MKNYFIFFCALLFLSASDCRGGERPSAPASLPAAAGNESVPKTQGCQGCHPDIQLDSNHPLACTSCHQGTDSQDKSAAHKGMLPAPAAPSSMAAACGHCHKRQLESCAQSSHYTLANAVNLVRSHFGMQPSLTGLTEIPDHARPGNADELVDDMLRRRCLRCHVYTAGDQYPYVQRGIGCASCHMQFIDGKLQSHSFIRPGEQQCQSCHYGNHVGSDFAGRYEHDYNWEYRTPYTTREPFLRPYGVELHQLAQDIHRQRGLTCLDCHSGEQLSGRQQPITCQDCHSPKLPAVPALPGLSREGQQLILRSVTDGRDHLVPQLSHPAHAKYKGWVDCQVCHAQWAFNDRPTHLLLSYLEDVDPWDRLTVQSSSRVETFLEHNLYSDEDELEPAMVDGISGRQKPGIWYLGFGQRRWEDILIDRDSDGIIKVFRPILDLRLSAVDENEEVLFDNIKGSGTGMLPYVPHTTGPAGLFYEQRFLHLLPNDQANSKMVR